MNSEPSQMMEGYDDEELLLKAFSNGKQEALRAIYEKFYRSIYYATDAIVKNEDEAEDIVTESFLKLWDRRGDFKSLGRVKSFLYVVSANAAKNVIRNQKIRSGVIKEISNSEEQYEKSALHAILSAEFFQQILDEIETLPPLVSSIIKLYYIEGLKSDEIAAELNISPQTARNYKITGLNLLKTGLIKKHISPSAAVFIAAALFNL